MARTTDRSIEFEHSLLLSFAWILLITCPLLSQTITVRPSFGAGDFPIVHQSKAADILYSRDDFKVVHMAATDLSADIERVTGKKPVVSDVNNHPIDTAVIIGTLGKSSLVDKIVTRGKLDASKVRGKWESFIIATVEQPLPNVRRALIIAGSDRRGTAFGVYELSRMIGVSPWHWWADVTPEKRPNLILSRGTIVSREPSVKYRGIFINDEDWGLQPWAAKTFEPETGDIGSKTYAKVFELLLRLKANTLWPAMHEVTRPFNSIPANARVADDYAIVIGSSHAKPMLRNNVGEWKADKNTYNFVTNPHGVTEYWEQRTKENGNYENIYTIGMRGIHDSPILGTKSQAERIPLLEKIFSVQRGMLEKNVDPKAENVPQIFCPYKEVLADYRAGLKVPDDVTIVFPDDNFGYIRQFPTAEEQKRKGGFGVYYHISYLGRPLSYLWLNTTPPALIREEMSKAYENGMRQLWIVNVGDIKPSEIGMEYFLRMAYDMNSPTVTDQNTYLRDWATREFGTIRSAEISDILDKYYRLGFQRKPEHLQWFLPAEPQRPSDLNLAEKLNRIQEYSDLRERADRVAAGIEPSKKDAFYQLVVYPVRSAALANERFFAAEIARDRASAAWAKRSIAADEAISAETKYFNETLSGGKWRHMMSPEMNAGQWPSMRSTPPRLALTDFNTPNPGDIKIGLGLSRKLPLPKASDSLFREVDGSISIEAENFSRSVTKGNVSWQIIPGLGKTGDSISLHPAIARTFANITDDSPSVEYRIAAVKGGSYSASFHLIPTQPLVPGNGLRFAFSIDGGEPQIIVVDKETEVSSRKWAQNILDQTTVGTSTILLSAGHHTFRIFAVDTGVVVDKVVLSSGKIGPSYFGPAETRFGGMRR